MLLFVLSGVVLLRMEERTLFVLLFQEPPRSTRFVVSGSRPFVTIAKRPLPRSPPRR